MSLFEQTTRPNPDVFFRRGDSNDVRLGEVVHNQPAAYDSADIVLLGLPQDDGVRRNKGRVGAAQAPDAIRHCLYRMSVGLLEAHKPLQLFDLGNTVLQDSLEATHAAHQAVVRQVLRDGKRLIVLGGGNDTSYPDCSALSLESDSVLAFNIDAHFDVRADDIRNSGTPYRQLLEEDFIQPEQFYEVAYQPFGNSPVYQHYLRDKGVTTFSLERVQAEGLRALLQRLLESVTGGAIFWGLDMDVVRAADAPGVSALNPTGLTGTDVCDLARIAGSDSRTRIFEITEVNPTYDIDERTCRLAAAVIWHFLNASQN